MKKIISVLLLISILASGCLFFVSCGGFDGNLETFFNEGDFYNNVGNVLYSIFVGENSFIPLIGDKNIELNGSVGVENYALNSKIVENGDVSMDFAMLLTENLDYEYEVELKAFDRIDLYKHCIQEDNKMFIDYGDVLNNKPLCYYDNGYNCFTDAKDSLVKCIKKASFSTDKDNYSLNGINFDADTVSFTLNSDVLTKWVSDVTNKLFSANSTQSGIGNLKDNLVYSEWYYSMLEVAAFFETEKLHTKWTRYYCDDTLSREVINVYDPTGHYIKLDVAYAVDEDTEYVEISVKGNDGGQVFDVLALSATRKNKSSGFTTKSKIMIGDEILITTSNSGNDKKASGKADFNLMNVVGEQKFTIKFDYEGNREGAGKSNGLGLAQVFNIKVEKFPYIGTDNFVSFDARLNIFANTTDAVPTVPIVEDYFDLGELKEINYYHSVGQLNFDKAIEAFNAYLVGETTYYQTPAPVVSPFKLDISFDDGKTFETNGDYGKEYVDIMTSDTCTFKYHYHTDEKDYPLNFAAEYYKDGKQYFTYDYATGHDFAIYHEGTTVYEVRHEIEKIVYTEYDQRTYDYTYPRTEYIYDHSGYCQYEERKLVYELYYDYYVNKYYFIFDEEGKLEIMLLVSSVDESITYLFVDEIKADASDNDFVLPAYEKVNILDYIE